MRALIVVLATFQFHLPLHDAVDSLCTVGLAPTTDLDSCFIMVQERWQQPRVFSRTGARGQEGQLRTFSVPDNIEALYWAETCDIAGNRIRRSGQGDQCDPKTMQVALTTDVPQNPPGTPLPSAEERVQWYDVAGRRLTKEPRYAGIYLWKQGSRHGRVVLLQ